MNKQYLAAMAGGRVLHSGEIMSFRQRIQALQSGRIRPSGEEEMKELYGEE